MPGEGLKVWPSAVYKALATVAAMARASAPIRGPKAKGIAYHGVAINPGRRIFIHQLLQFREGAICVIKVYEKLEASPQQ